MANDIKVRFRTFLPGAGFDSAGGAKQGKTRVVGRIAVTSYTKGGEAFNPVDVGLTAIDHIDLRVNEQTGSPSAQTERSAIYSPSANQFYLVIDSLTGAATGAKRVEYDLADTETLTFVAEGDSAADIELTVPDTGTLS